MTDPQWRLAFDVLWVLIAVVMLARLRRVLVKGAFSLGATWIVPFLVAYYLLQKHTRNGPFRPDVEAGSMLLGLTIIGRFDWGRFVTGEYRKDGVDGWLVSHPRWGLLGAGIGLAIYFGLTFALGWEF